MKIENTDYLAVLLLAMINSGIWGYVLILLIR